MAHGVRAVYAGSMTKLDAVLERIRQLPPERQEMIAVELEFLLDHDGEGGPFLTDEQWADLRQRTLEDSGERVSHEEIVAEFLPSRGR